MLRKNGCLERWKSSKRIMSEPANSCVTGDSVREETGGWGFQSALGRGFDLE